jgi:cell division cycle protein 37
MQDCFESRDISQLQTVLSQMPRDDAAYHLDRCIKSGLWVPNAKDAENDEQVETESNEEDEQQQQQQQEVSDKKVVEDVKKLHVEQ